MGTSPRTENLENEAGAVDDLGLPLAFEIALLNRRQRPIDDHEPDLLLGDDLAQILDPALADQRSRGWPVEANNFAGNDIEIERARSTVAGLAAGCGL